MITLITYPDSMLTLLKQAFPILQDTRHNKV